MSNKGKSPIWTRLRGKSWYYIFEITKHPRKLTSKGGYATEQEAFEAGLLAYADWKSGNVAVTSARIKLREYLAAWLENVVRPNVKRTTYMNYSSAVQSRINPYLGAHVVQDLRPRDIDTWLQMLASAGMSHGTISSTKTVLSIALRYAVYPGELIKTNPTTGLTIPRSAPKKIIPRVVVTPEQFAAIPASVKWYSAVKLLYHTGMRLGEALGLAWSDIDLKTGEICIMRQRVRRGYFDTPKTDSSTRTIYADAELLSYLRALKASQAKDEVRLGQAYQLVYEDAKNNRDVIHLPKRVPLLEGLLRRPLVCLLSNGRALPREYVTNELHRRGLNPHSFRHTHATNLIAAGAKPVAVAARLGHADVGITMNLYTHNTEEMQRETMRIFERFVVK
jgi:phage integrase family prophage lambdaba04, site-specific recombinase|nr:MAG TPA: Integrase [Caudoviricetes sp.]